MSFDLESSMRKVHIGRLKWVINQRKHAERIQRTLEHLQTSDVHQLNMHKSNLKYWFQYYEEAKEKAKDGDKIASIVWGNASRQEHILKNAEAFIYRVISNIPTR